MRTSNFTADRTDCASGCKRSGENSIWSYGVDKCCSSFFNVPLIFRLIFMENCYLCRSTLISANFAFVKAICESINN